MGKREFALKREGVGKKKGGGNTCRPREHQGCAKKKPLRKEGVVDKDCLGRKGGEVLDV